MALNGCTFDACLVESMNDASLYGYLNNDVSTVLPNRRNELTVSVSGTNLLLSTGQAIICGRFIDVTEVITVPVVGNGYLVFEIDLSKTNTSTGIPGHPGYEYVNNQLSVKTVTSLRQDDLHNGGIIYHFNLGSFSNTGSLTFTRNDGAYLSYQNGMEEITIDDVEGLSDILTNITNELSNIEEVDLTEIFESIDHINQTLDDIIQSIEDLETVDLTALYAAIDDLNARIDALEQEEEIDMTAVLTLIAELEDRVVALEEKVITINDVSGLQAALDNKVNGPGLTIWTGNLAAYNAIATKNPMTIYVITA